MRRRRYLVAQLIIVSLILILAMKNSTQQEQIKTLPPIIGGFGINTPEQAMNAFAEGIQVVFAYGQPPAQEGVLGKKLQSLHMKVVDGFISSYLHYYECNHAQMLKNSSTFLRQFCAYFLLLTDERALLSLITTHLQQVKDNQLIIGYWVLDDWTLGDAGSARPLLIKIHQIIQRYTPERFAACGFGGSLSYDWDDPIAENFSPQGCDRVGLYIYSSSQSNTVPLSSSDIYNWSMSGLLSKMLASLKKRGWDMTKEPLIGIGQAFGGPKKNTQEYWVPPNERNIETQSRSFCEHGATSLAFYGWTDLEFGPRTLTPMNSSEIQTGIQHGITVCKAYWAKHAK